MIVALKSWFSAQPLLLPALSLVAAIVLTDSSGVIFLFGCFSLALCLFFSALCSHKVLIISCIISFSAAVIHHLQLIEQDKAIQLASDPNNSVEVYGIIDAPPRHFPSGTTEVIINVISEPTNNTLDGHKILTYVTTGESLSVGEKIWMKGNLNLPRSPKNPELFDKKSYLYRHSISVILQADAISPTGKIARSHKVANAAELSRQWIRQKLTSGIENTDAADIIIAMFLGEKPLNDGHIVTDFKNSGTIHVFAVSGLHVMMIGAIFTLLLKLCRLPSSIWVPCVILTMFFYAIVTGMRPPAMRASIMGAIVLSAILLLRKPSLPSCLWLSAIIALLWNTHSLFLPGFQLSYLVLIAIAFTAQWWAERYKWINHVDPFMPESLLNLRQRISLWLRKKLSASLAVSTSAWSGSSILIWLYFGIITPLAIIASLPLMFFVFALLGTCCLSLIAGSLSPTLGNKVNQFNSFNATLAHKTSQFFASLPNTRYESQPWSSGERVVIYHLNDGGGVYLSLGGGILLDAGNQSTFKSQILPGLKKNGADIDTLITSHFDINHIQGLTQAMEEYPIKQILIPTGKSKSPAHKELISKANELKVNIITATESTFPVDQNINLEIIHAPDEYLPLADDRCLAFLLHWHDKRILFLNDSGHHFGHWVRETKDQDIKQFKPDVLVIGMHISDSSIHPDIIEMLSPKTVIATQTFYPATQSRNSQWINAVQKSSTLYLLNQVGAVTITKNSNQLDFDTVINH